MEFQPDNKNEWLRFEATGFHKRVEDLKSLSREAAVKCWPGKVFNQQVSRDHSDQLRQRLIRRAHGSDSCPALNSNDCSEIALAEKFLRRGSSQRLSCRVRLRKGFETSDFLAFS